MPSPFPGMNPYLEQPEIWSQVWYLEVRQVETGAVITVIEILSPKNKRPVKL